MQRRSYWPIRHGLRATELCTLRWAQIDLRHGRLHVNRAKGGQESVHPFHGPELRALRPLQGHSPYVFITEAGHTRYNRLVPTNGPANRQGCKLEFPVHPHMLRHSTGYKLANQGEDTRSLAHYLGHRNLQSTARYTALRRIDLRDFGRIRFRQRGGDAASPPKRPSASDRWQRGCRRRTAAIRIGQ